jgi:integrase
MTLLEQPSISSAVWGINGPFDPGLQAVCSLRRRAGRRAERRALVLSERPKQRSRRKGRRLSPEQLEKVIETAERLTPSFAALIVLLAYTGLRAREALGPRWQDIDLDAPSRTTSGARSPHS